MYLHVYMCAHTHTHTHALIHTKKEYTPIDIIIIIIMSRRLRGYP